jgi:hypothetical protein
MEDLSGQPEDNWLSRNDVAAHLGELLQEIGRVYAPFLIANAQALMRSQTEFETLIDGQRWEQPVFPYQGKCLEVLRQARLALHPDALKALDALLAGTGCEGLFVNL